MADIDRDEPTQPASSSKAGDSAALAHELIGIARVGLAQAVLPEAMLWDELDLDDPDDRRFGDFELLERIGRGGMGVVFRALQVSLGREVAIKFIVGSLADNPRAIATFFAEARAAARLHHPYIVPVFETGKLDGMHFFSMPLLSGRTLAHRLVAGRMPTGEAIELMLKLCAAVDYAHGFGLLHLDLKPANVLFDERGQPLIGDFGLARHIDSDGGVDALDISGTAAYMAPEQIDPGKQRLTQRTDVYALGAILYELLVGHSPHGDGAAEAQMQAALSGSIVSPRTIDPAIGKDIDAICMHCLRIDPVQRYCSVAELQSDLARCRDGNVVSVREPGLRERITRSVRKNPTLAWAGAGILVALSVGLAATSWQWQRAEQARVDAEQQRTLANSEAARTRDLAGFMAAAFPMSSLGDGRSDSARDAVAWLKRRAPYDPAMQRAVLTSFRLALVTAGKGDAVAALMNEIIDQLGVGYRDEQVERLAKLGDRDSLIAATLIGIPRGDAASSSAHETVMQRLFNDYSSDALALYAVALACHVQQQPCTHADYFARLTTQFPDNAVNWVLVPSGGHPTDTLFAENIMHASAAHAFNDQLSSLFAVMRKALRDQPVPQSILQPMQAIMDESDVAPSLRRNTIDSVALPVYANWIYACKPGSSAMGNVAGLKKACGIVAENALHSADASILAKMISVPILRRLYKGTPTDAEAKNYRLEYVWFGTHIDSTPAGKEKLLPDIIRYGEWEAWQRQAERAGFSRTPPPGWMPANPQVLLMQEERTPAASSH
ncbi:MAG: serine/threonine-protein kinase [Lysobacteraceae bacterium]